MQLAHITDCHLMGESHHRHYGVNPNQSFGEVINLVIQYQPDAVIVTGDISGDNSLRSYQYFRDTLSCALSVDWRVIPGNHDNNVHFQTVLGDKVLLAGEPWRQGKWLVHGLDTRWQGARGQIVLPELEAIAAEIAQRAETYHLLALHHHCLPTKSWMDKHSLINPQVLTGWLKEHPEITLAVYGHVHAGCESQVAQTTLLSAPSTGWQWDLQPEFAVDKQPAGFRLITLGDDGSWQTKIRRLP